MSEAPFIEALCEQQALVHVVCSGAGTELQRYLWETPGASEWLSGASFPYAQKETDEFLGFTPDSYCSEKTAIQLAATAYMRAFVFGGKNAVGISVTASVASVKEHRGDHRVHACVVTNDKCLVGTLVLPKGVGFARRFHDDEAASQFGLSILAAALDIKEDITPILQLLKPVSDVELRDIIMEHPMFLRSGQRTKDTAEIESQYIAIMPGAYNPPHAAHFQIASLAATRWHNRVLHQITIDSPHKPTLRAQDILQRAKMLKGHDAIFTLGDPLYIQKAKAFPGCPIVLGTDALVRMLDPKWGPEIGPMLDEFARLSTRFIIADRIVDGKLTTYEDILEMLAERQLHAHNPYMFLSVGKEHWDLSSSEIRKNVANVRSG